MSIVAFFIMLARVDYFSIHSTFDFNANNRNIVVFGLYQTWYSWSTTSQIVVFINEFLGHRKTKSEATRSYEIRLTISANEEMGMTMRRRFHLTSLYFIYAFYSWCLSFLLNFFSYYTVHFICLFFIVFCIYYLSNLYVYFFIVDLLERKRMPTIERFLCMNIHFLLCLFFSNNKKFHEDYRKISSRIELMASPCTRGILHIDTW